MCASWLSTISTYATQVAAWAATFSLAFTIPTAAEQGKAKLRIFDFKTTWSEFQKAFQTAAVPVEAELHILNFETTWSDCC